MLMKTRAHLFAGLMLCLSTAGVRADIYAFVDENGVPNFSNYPVDKRYKLFRREGPSTPVASRPDAPRTVLAVPRAVASRRYADLIRSIAAEHRIDPALLHAVVTVESGYNERARSPKGAAGLMQLMPATAARYDVRDVWNPAENLRGGTRYLRDLLALFNDNLPLAVAAYNAGEQAVMQAGRRIPPFAETRDYVPKVLSQYDHYRRNAAY